MTSPAKLELLLFSLLMIFSCGQEVHNRANRSTSDFVDGITMVAPSKPLSENPTLEIREIGAGWLAIVPYAFTPSDRPMVRYDESKQWWGETREGIVETIRYCHESGLKVMLKPQIWAHHSWSGDIYYDDHSDWLSWEEGYADYILQMAEIADSMEVELLCIGTELKQSVAHRPLFWKNLIVEVRERFGGKLTYASNWDSYTVPQFWSDLDYIGINAYFPLIDSQHPDRSALSRAWKPIRKEIEKFSQKWETPVLFTEFGYLSTDYNAYNTWEKEDRIQELPVNEKAQAVALDVLMENFYPYDWWAGGFIWKWYTSQSRIRNKDKDYTVQGKQGQEILQKWYNK